MTRLATLTSATARLLRRSDIDPDADVSGILFRLHDEDWRKLAVCCGQTPPTFDEKAQIAARLVVQGWGCDVESREAAE